jgi:hypothetical protein
MTSAAARSEEVTIAKRLWTEFVIVMSPSEASCS